MDGIGCHWRGDFTNGELNALHADAFDHQPFDDDWQQLVHKHSLGWVTARSGDDLVGFVNVIWDGLVHAWIQDTMVSSSAQHRGIGTALLATATDHARTAGCEWLHVDFDEDLSPFYYGAAGFTATNAGLINLIEPH